MGNRVSSGHIKNNNNSNNNKNKNGNLKSVSLASSSQHSGQSTSNMYRRDTTTQWTEQQLLQYQLELQKEMQRQTQLQSQQQIQSVPPQQQQQQNQPQIVIENASNGTNIFTCCFNSSKQKQKRRIRETPIDDEHDEQSQRDERDEPEQKIQEIQEIQEETQTVQPVINIADIPEIKENESDHDEEVSINDRLVKIEPIPEKKEDDLNLAVIDTTNAFLELLQLDTMSKHLQEMRDRKLFLEKAKNDLELPEEERQIAAWITNTYLSKSPTNIYSQVILENIIKKQNHEHEHDHDHDEDTNANQEDDGHADDDKKEQSKQSKQKSADIEDSDATKQEIASKEEEKEIKTLSKSELIEITNKIQPNLSSNDDVIQLLSTTNDWNFSVFEFVELCNDFSLSLLMVTICKTRDMLSSLNIPIMSLINYMNLIDLNYKDNPYHNSIHAADVLLNMYYFMKSSIFLQNISVLDCFAILISASVHDVGHPGHSNTYEINTESALAITYNDQSVLENMHISLAWKLLKSKNSDFLVNLNKSQRKRFRKVLIDSVLATDMSQHSLHSETLENLVEKYENKQLDLSENKFSDQFLPIALHTADLGNLCKETKYYNEWVDRLMNEFFNQGDKERELGIEPISFLCDRFKVNIHSGQVGFINYVIRPWFIKFGKLLREESHNKLFLNLLNENLLYMQERANQTKDAQEEIKKNEDKLLVKHEDDGNDANDEHDDDDDQHDDDDVDDEEEDEDRDIPQPLPSSSSVVVQSKKPIIHPIEGNSRTSKSYSIVAMNIPEMRSKLLEYKDKEQEHQ